MESTKHEFVIVGSGAGGATLAKELAKRGKDVLVVEKGKDEQKLGTFQDCIRFYDVNKLTKVPRRSAEGVILWRTIMAGGTTVVSCGNGVRCLEKELADLGVTLGEEFAEAEAEMHVAPIAQRLLSEGAEAIRSAAETLGYKMDPMPKFIDPVACKKCGQCVAGCASSSKWTALDYLEEARKAGAEVAYNTSVRKVLIENGKAMGIIAKGPKGQRKILADKVIIAAGGLGTPVILLKSGVENAGRGLFVDLFVNVYGVTSGPNQIHEPTMPLVDLEFHKSKGFLLSPFVNHPAMVRFIEVGMKGLTMPDDRLLGIMIKTKDEPAGRVYANGKISKPVTEKDWVRLNEGSSIARAILVKAGADEGSIVVSHPQGAHPGGTAAIGTIVDSDLQTKVENLYVCDSSVLPSAPGLPPILTIVALAKRLAKKLAL